VSPPAQPLDLDAGLRELALGPDQRGVVGCSFTVPAEALDGFVSCACRRDSCAAHAERLISFLVMLKPSDILDDVRRAFTKLPKGKADHNHHWVNAYGLLGALDPEVRAILIAERCPPGAGGGQHYSAASVVSDACEMLAARDEVEIDYYAPMNATYTIDGRPFEAGYALSGIYRRK
jgi:hypothetical protein